MSEAPREQTDPTVPPPPQVVPAYAPVAPPPSSQAVPAYAQAAQPAYAAAPPAAPSSLEIGGRVVRLLGARAIWAADQGWRLVQPRLGWVLLTGLLVSVIGVLSLMLLLPRLLAGMAAPSDPRVAALPPAPSVEEFLRGQQTFDADLMWGSFSDELRQNLEGREITRDTLAQRIETERQAGQRYSGYKYIGGVQLSGRQAMYFYAVDYTSPQARGTMSFVFTVGSDGKIVSVQ